MPAATQILNEIKQCKAFDDGSAWGIEYDLNIALGVQPRPAREGGHADLSGDIVHVRNETVQMVVGISGEYIIRHALVLVVLQGNVEGIKSRTLCFMSQLLGLGRLLEGNGFGRFSFGVGFTGVGEEERF